MTHTTSDTDSITLTVTADGIFTEDVDSGASVIRFIGTDPATGENVIFAVDRRPAADLAANLVTTGEVTVAVEGFQILGKGAF